MKTTLKIRNCESTFRFQCPKLWSELFPTERADIRHCDMCNCDVFLCKTDEETIEHARAGHCIARELPDEEQLPYLYVGQPNVPVPTPEQHEAAKLFGRELAIDDSIKNADAGRSCPKCSYPAPRWRVACRVCGFEMGRQLEGSGG